MQQIHIPKLGRYTFLVKQHNSHHCKDCTHFVAFAHTILLFQVTNSFCQYHSGQLQYHSGQLWYHFER